MGRKLISKAIEERVGKPFRQIVKENLTLGIGRYEAAARLETLCKKHRKDNEDHIKVLHSTLWYTIKRMIVTGELCEVEGDPSTPPIFDFNHGRKEYIYNKQNDPTRIKIESEWHCSICNHQWREESEIKSLDMMCVRSKSCPECERKGSNSFGKVVLQFEHEGIRARKAVCLSGGRNKESFIDEQDNPCSSPFESEIPV